MLHRRGRVFLGSDDSASDGRVGAPRPHKGGAVGRQVNFYMFGEDLVAFEAKLIGEGTRIIAAQSPAPQPILLTKLHTAPGEPGWMGTYLVRPDDLQAVAMYPISAQPQWAVNAHRSPVVEFDHGYQSAEVLRRGRLYFISDEWTEDGRRASKPIEFVRWADRLLRWVRAHYRRESPAGFYMGPATWTWYAEQRTKPRLE